MAASHESRVSTPSLSLPLAVRSQAESRAYSHRDVAAGSGSTAAAVEA